MFNIIRNTRGTMVQTSDNVRDILIDGEDDLQDIPEDTAPGSVAHKADMTLMYMKDNDGTWKKIGGV